ncbi:PAAR domain-containing protein [Paraherbaspirillum soli]|uniref:PAAR domain-containing protein n=1 Tax=Paraherbaspirillum soli TaxID=631222 RepID=A0ABW0M8W1_9BURK
MSRPTFGNTPKAVVIIGDKTSHGGVVLSGDKTSVWHDIGMARVGDTVYCPKCSPRIQTITEGSSNCPTKSGQFIALHGDMTSCGATLIAAGAGTPNINKAITFLTRFEKSKTQRYDEQVRIKDQEGNPILNTPYHITDESGNEYKGVTDENGCCDRVYTDESENLTILIGVPALEKW